jgi:predicted aldo/keto reductase-like oxidoreductase
LELKIKGYFKMMETIHRVLRQGVRSVSAAAVLAVAACAPQTTAPVQVQSSTPTVTYKYQNDQQLLDVNQNAAAFCSRYQAVPQAVDFSDNPDGSKAVVFNCEQAVTPSPQQMQTNSSLTYTYGTDAELLAAQRNAQAYCMNGGQSQMSSEIAPNPDGTKTIMFKCNGP